MLTKNDCITNNQNKELTYLLNVKFVTIKHHTHRCAHRLLEELFLSPNVVNETLCV